MRRLRTQRGAVAVMVATLMVVLIGFTALAVDLGALWMDRKELQNGADAAALALAQSCAEAANCVSGKSVDVSSSEWTEAETLAFGNKRDAIATEVEVVSIEYTITETEKSVTVALASERQHWFAPVIGQNSSAMSASATASWGGITEAFVLPLTASDCVVTKKWLDSGEDVTLYVLSNRNDKTEAPNTDDDGCPADTSGPHIIPGGFGWLDVAKGGDCEVSSVLGMVPGDTGVSGPTSDKLYGCDDVLDDLVGEEVLLPLYEHAAAQGDSGYFRLVAFAHIRVESYCLIDNSKRPWFGPDGVSCNPNPPPGKPELGPFITGTFLARVSLDAFIGGSDNGSQAVQLTG
ncbi:pilus assembly protein TadG-related protein [Tessaracoccus sp. Z1128]